MIFAASPLLVVRAKSTLPYSRYLSRCGLLLYSRLDVAPRSFVIRTAYRWRV